ncbi:hypothetical protein AB3N04_06850 [Alkalihalophilus sp. As8PL]|uniref:Holin n=1 Tax=Alkalihalophilus sp. As8PL TaxID=3237103 RepID=A0AB39BVV9_9BACI
MLYNLITYIKRIERTDNTKYNYEVKGVIILQEFADRVLSFLPAGVVFWSAILTTIFAALTQMFFNWYVKKAELPWMREENQQNKEKFIAAIKQQHQGQSEKEGN